MSTTSPEDNSTLVVISEDATCRKVESIGSISYEELQNLPSDKLSKISEFDFEQCYFKMINIPKGMKEKYVSIWEIGLLAFYENPDTNESIKFHWWAEKDTNDYIANQEQKNDIRKISKDDIIYYCNFAQFEDISSSGNAFQPYHVSIRWVEDDKCFSLKIESDTPLCDDVVEICRLKKFPLKK